MQRKVFFEEAGSPSRPKTLADLKRPATERQINFARSIADLLELDYPDFDDFNATSRFISENKDLFYAEKEARENAMHCEVDDDEDDDDIPF